VRALCFARTDFETRAATLPPSYRAEVLAVAEQVGDQLCISRADYERIAREYGPQRHDEVNGTRERHRSPVSVPSPTFALMIANFAKESVRWAARGCPLASAEVLRQRQAICEACPRWDRQRWFGTGGCSLCGCSQVKLAWATTRCPDQPPRWGVEA
jgi:hypothetical protein